MLKKMVILGVLGFIAVTAISGTKVASYLRSEARSMRQQAEDNIPPEKEIDRLKNEVNLLDKDVKTLVNQLAKERVEVNQLKTKVDEMAAKQSKDKELFNARLDAVEKAEGQVVFGNRTVSVSAAMAELKADEKRLKNAEKSLLPTSNCSPADQDPRQHREAARSDQEPEVGTGRGHRGDGSRTRPAEAAADREQVPDGRHPAVQDQGRPAEAADQGRGQA